MDLFGARRRDGSNPQGAGKDQARASLAEARRAKAGRRRKVFSCRRRTAELMLVSLWSARSELLASFLARKARRALLPLRGAGDDNDYLGISIVNLVKVPEEKT